MENMQMSERYNSGLKASQSLYERAEYDANRFNINCLAILCIIVTISEVLNEIGIFKVSLIVMRFSTILAFSFFITPLVVYLVHDKCLKKDKIRIEDISNFKKNTIVDNNRPKLCADRLDGIILTSISWTKNITLEEIKMIINNICVLQNESLEKEIGFKSVDVAKRVIILSEIIDQYCHSDEDNYMMQLLSKITKYAIDKKFFTYDDLYFYDEEYIINIFEKIKDADFVEGFMKFKNITRNEIEKEDIPFIKKRNISPLVNGLRIK